MRKPTACEGAWRILLLAFVSACTGVLNDPAAQNGGMALSLNDDQAYQYLWKQLEEIKGNKAEVTITGDCGGDVSTIRVSSKAETAVTAASEELTKELNNPASFEIPCVDGKLAAPFLGDRKFPANGRYILTFTGVTKDITQAKVEVQKIYDYYYVENPSAMVDLACKDISNDATIPFENTDECTILKTQNMRLDGTCTDAATAHNTTIKVVDTPYTCASFTHSFASLTTGAHLTPITWIDAWGNTYTRTLLLKKLDVIDWTGGSVSFVASSTIDTANHTLFAVGTPFVTEASDVNATPAFTRSPASSSGTGTPLTMAPGFLSLVYGLDDDS